MVLSLYTCKSSTIIDRITCILSCNKKEITFLLSLIVFNSNSMTFSIAIFLYFFFSLLYLLPHPIPKSIDPIIHAYSVFPVLYDMYIDNISVINAIIDKISHKFFLCILFLQDFILSFLTPNF